MAFGFDNVTHRPYNDDHEAAEINAAAKRQEAATAKVTAAARAAAKRCAAKLIDAELGLDVVGRRVVRDERMAVQALEQRLRHGDDLGPLYAAIREAERVLAMYA